MTSQPPDAVGRVRAHWPLAAVVLAAAALTLPSLGRDSLWADEGDTAVLASSILKFGVPTAWDGVTFSDSDYGDRLTDDFVMVSHPWLQYYAVAGAFALFGESPFSARLPFAVSGLLTIVFVYVIVLRTSGVRAVALSAALLVALSSQFLIYSRQSRQYSMNAAVTCLLVLQFTRLKSWPQSLLFAVISILLFHIHPGAIAPIAALGLLTIVRRPFADLRKWFWLAMPVVVLLTIPWLFLARSGYTHNTEPLQSLQDLGLRVAQFAVETASVTTLVGALLVYLWLRRRGPAAHSLQERSLAVMLLTIIAALGAVMAATQSRETIWVAGLRETPVVIPFVAILTSIALAPIRIQSSRLWTALLMILFVTRLGDLTPWTAWQQPTVTPNRNAIATFHTPTKALDRVLHTDLVAHARSLMAPSPGTVTHVSGYLRQYARPGDIVITNYEWESVYFHTGLPQGMKILRSYPIYDAARARGLPAYVFGADGVRWIVWRRTWGAYRGQACDQILKSLVDAGIAVELVAAFPETTWENRENLHYRRFSEGRYMYGWFQNVPDTLVYRVDWPDSTGNNGPR